MKQPKKYVTTLLGVLLLHVCSWAQTTVKGTVTDAQTGETLIGANVVYAPGKGTVTDLDGNFSMVVDNAEYTLEVSFVGYNPFVQIINAQGGTVRVNIKMQSEVMLNEVKVVADVARQRETPVAFTNVLPAKIEEKLAGQDIPMILNTTPGVYATQQGGGDGDARITIRGFNQRNVAVMLDGIPVNDMENGWVYWSNWFGLDQVTRSIQVQRGLGASKLALPSVGGTMNILTKGIENKRSFAFKQEVDGELKLRSSFGYTSGRLKNGWGITLAGSYKRGGGWVEQTFANGWFYFAKIEKQWKNHIFGLSGFGAPQRHDQRLFRLAVAQYDTVYAKSLGITKFPAINHMGIRYNQHWGYLRRDRTDANAPTEVMMERINHYHKPQASLRHFWTGEKLSVSNIFYLSVGQGGGTRPRSSITNTQWISDNRDSIYADGNQHYGRINWQSIYNANAKPTPQIFGPPIPPINTNYSNSLYYSTNYMVDAVNNHYWYGYLSTLNYQPTKALNLSGGVDLRYYKGEHYMALVDLMGGDYAIDKADLRIDYRVDSLSAMKYPGDKLNYYNDGLVRWGGIFGQAEFKYANISSFVNITYALSNYKKVDYFNKTESPWVAGDHPGFTIKGGLNYNINDNMNAFVNAGYLSKTRAFQYYFRGTTTNLLTDTDNEHVKAVELGYNFGSPIISFNLNGYYTAWTDKPAGSVRTKRLSPISGEEVNAIGFIPGMDAKHTGIEFDFVYKILDNLELQGLLSLGDWTWNKEVRGVLLFDEDDENVILDTLNFDARGIHVGDAAQTQYSGSLRYEPIKGLYLGTQYTYFARHYSDFNPEQTTDKEGNPIDSWQIPSYGTLDISAGYGFKITDKIRAKISCNIINTLNSVYISDARNNDEFNMLPSYDFDAKSATVFMGQGRRFTSALQISF